MSFDAESERWALVRLPNAPWSVRRLVLLALERGWCCWQVNDGGVELRKYALIDEGRIDVLEVWWTNTKAGSKRFSRARFSELREVAQVRKLADVTDWLQP